MTAEQNVISIVDDDDSVRRATRLLIKSFGFQAEAFESVEKFLSSCHLKDSSCLIVDVRMPGSDGLQLQGQLAAAGRNIPLIFVSAHADNETRRRAMQSGAVAFLEKPFGGEQLLQAIRSALNQFDGELDWRAI